MTDVHVLQANTRNIYYCWYFRQWNVELPGCKIALSCSVICECRW